MQSIFLVFAGGGAGAVLRYLLGRALPVVDSGWPWPTFVANVAGGFAMGVLAGWLSTRQGLGEPLQLLLGVGLLGGFTTFSAYSLEIVRLFERGQALVGVGYAAASVLTAVAALSAGLFAARQAIS